MADGFLDITVWITNHKGEKKPKTIGWAKVENGEVKGRIDVVPTNGWDGSFKAQEPRNREQRLSAQQPRAPAEKPWGTSGHGANAKHTALPEDDDGEPLPF